MAVRAYFRPPCSDASCPSPVSAYFPCAAFLPHELVNQHASPPETNSGHDCDTSALDSFFSGRGARQTSSLVGGRSGWMRSPCVAAPLVVSSGTPLVSSPRARNICEMNCAYSIMSAYDSRPSRFHQRASVRRLGPLDAEPPVGDKTDVDFEFGKAWHVRLVFCPSPKKMGGGVAICRLTPKRPRPAT